MKKYRDSKKKVASLLLCACVAGAALGGGLMAMKKDVVGQAAAPNTMDEFLIGSWISFYDPAIEGYENQLKDMAESGVNWHPNPLSLAGHTAGGASLTYSMTELNEMYKKYNVYFSAVSQTTASITMSESNKLVEEVTGNNLTNCNSYHVKDEPSAAVMEDVGSIFHNCLEKDPTRFPYVNLFPNYAGAANLGGTYEDYIYNWIDTIGADNLEYLAYDHYPFTQFETVRSSYFSDLETVRAAAYDNGKLKTLACTQLGSWNGMVRPNANMARWNCNTFIAYGMKGLMHFNWVAPAYKAPSEGGEGMQDFVLSATGEKTDLYEPMQIYNWQTRQLGPLLMQMDVAHAYHVGTVADGAEALPKSFVFQPTTSADNMIFSLAYGKNGKDIYVMVFNNELDGGKKTYDINVDTSAGVTSLTRYTTDSFETLPDLYQALPALGEETVDVSNGKFTVEMNPGDIAIYKLNGDVQIKEPLRAPKMSMKSGTYIGEQQLSLYALDEGAEVYYTTDGTQPTYKSKRYINPITIGEEGEFGYYNVKAITIRGTEISDAVTGEFIISDGSLNVAQDKPIQVMSYDMTEDWSKELVGFNKTNTPGEFEAKFINDGGFDFWYALGSVGKGKGWAVIDFGKVYTIDRVVYDAYHDWANVTDHIIEVATKPDFSDAVRVYDHAGGLATRGGITVSFEPKQAQYLRVSNYINNHVGEMSVFTEIQAFSAYNAGENLLANKANWQVTSGGTWVHENGVVKQTNPANQNNWTPSYTYKAKTFKNFVLEANMKMETGDPGQWGYVGFGLYKPNVTDDVNSIDQGFYAAIEPRGRVLLWNGQKPELGPEDANVAGFSLGAEFNFRIISFNDMISISVNGQPVMYVRGETFDREAGYISIHSGLIPLTVRTLTMLELDEDDLTVLDNQQVLKYGMEDRMAVERFVPKAELIESLPKTASATDTQGNAYNLAVNWTCANYNPTTSGWYTFVGEYVNLPETLVNLYDVTAKINVFVKPELDKSDLEKLVQTAKTLNPSDFTPETFETVRVKLEAAESILADPYLVQSDIGVGVFQLYDAMYLYLVSVVDKSALETAISQAQAVVEVGGYTELSMQNIQNAIARAQTVLEDNLAGSVRVSDAITALNRACQQAISEEKVVQKGEKPTVQDFNAESGCGSVVGETFAAVGIALGAGMLLKKRRRDDK